MLRLRTAVALVLCFCFCTGISSFFEVSWRDIKKNIVEKKYKKAILNLQKFKSKEDFLGKKHFALGKLLFDQGQYSLAGWHFKQYFFYDRVLSSYVYSYLGEVNLKSQKNKEARLNFNQALKQKPSRFLKRDIKLNLAKLDFQEKKYSKSYKTLKGLQRRWRRSSLEPEIMKHLALVEDKRKKYRNSCRWVKNLYRKYPTFKELKLVEGQIQMKGVSQTCSISLRDQQKRIRSLQWAGLFVKSQQEIDSFKALVSKVPKNKKKYFSKYEVDFLQAYHLVYEGYPKKALKIIDSYKKEKGKDWEYLVFLAKVGIKSSNSKLALKAFKKAIQVAPSAHKKKEALFDEAFIAYQFRKYDEAYKKFVSYFRKNKLKKKVRNQVLWYLGWIQHLRGQHKSSNQYFDKLIKIYSQRKSLYITSLQKLDYWKAMNYVQLKNYQKAQQIFMKLSQNSLLGYYSFLSYYRLRNISSKSPLNMYFIKGEALSDFVDYQGKIKNIARSPTSVEDLEETSYEKMLSESETKPSTISDEDIRGFSKFLSHKKTSAEKNIFFQRGHHLKSLGFYELSVREFYEVETRSSDLALQRVLMNQYQELGAHHRAAYIATIFFSKARANYGLERGRSLWAFAYPEAYKKYVQKYSKDFLVPKSLIWGIMRSETFYRPQARSSVGARGLMQVMPHTGQKLANLLRTDFSKDKLLIPQFNIKLGTHYLYRLAKKFKNKIPLVAGSYNAGPHNVTNWIYRFGDLSLDRFIEHIPYSETRIYIKKVLRNYGTYSLIYGDSSLKMNWLVEPLQFPIREPATKENWEPI